MTTNLRNAGIVWIVSLAAALGVLLLWVWFSRVTPNESAAAEASSAAIFPIELHPDAGKDLPDRTVREPF
jgi:hypothetical protein